MHKGTRWLCTLTLGAALIHPPCSAAQAPVPADLVGTWSRADMSGGWPDSLHMVQEILTLRADSTYRREWRPAGNFQKGKWRLTADSLYLMLGSDTAIRGKTAWPQGPFRVAVQEHQLSWGSFFDKGFPCRDLAYTHVDTTTPLPAVPSDPPVTVKREDLAGTWVHGQTDTLTLRLDSTWAEVGKAVGPDLKVNSKFSRYWGPNFKIRNTWTVVPGDRLVLFWDTRSDTDPIWSHKEQGSVIKVRGQEIVVEDRDCDPTNDTVYRRVAP